MKSIKTLFLFLLPLLVWGQQPIISTLDPYPSQTSLLVKTRNNWFNKDNSSNNYSVTTNGNVRPATRSPFSTDGSVLFDGSSDFLTFTNQTFTGNFTVECWYYQTANSTNYSILFGGSNVGVSAANTQFYVTNTGGISWLDNAAVKISPSGTANKNQWNHIAFVRSGSTTYIFLNGTQVGTATNSASVQIDRIGDVGSVGAGYSPNGYICNVRISDIARYTTTFTPSATPFVVDANTILLTCQSPYTQNNNTFLDHSTNDFPITRNGNVAQGSFSPFVGSSGSMYFDGSGDYLTIPSNSAQYISTGDFIIEAWVYITSTGRRVIVSQTENSASPYRGWIFYISTTNKLTFEGSNGVSIASSTNFVTNQWVHVAASRVGSTTYLFNNGTIVASGTVSITDFTGNLTIGQFTSSIAGSEFSGYMSCLGLKKTVGIASNFTPSTTPLQTDANTIFLAKGENAAIYDGARKNNIETVGDTKVVSTLSGPFTGQNPIYFDGSGDYLTIANNSNIDLGSGNFTIDGYMYATTGSSPIILAVQRTAANANGLYLTWSNASTMQFYLGGGSWFVGIDQTGFTRAAWNYFQFTRNGSTVTVNRNGTNLNTTTSVTGTVTTGLPLRIGTDYTLTGTGDAHYLSDFRITKKERVNTQQLRPSSEF